MFCLAKPLLPWARRPLNDQFQHRLKSWNPWQHLQLYLLGYFGFHGAIPVDKKTSISLNFSRISICQHSLAVQKGSVKLA